MPEAALIMFAHRRVVFQKLVGAQQQFGEIHHAFALALCLIKLIDFHHAAAEGIVRFHGMRTQAFFLGAADETLDIARREFFVVDIGGFQQALDGGELILRIENLEGLGQPGVAMVSAQQAVAQSVESPYPHAARIDG